MKPSDYIPNEPERNPLHEFICASVAACLASIYPRADPQRFVEIVNRTKAPACIAQAPVADYCTRNGCDCPCCEAAHAKLRAIPAETSCIACRDGRIAAAEAGLFRTLSFARAELSPDDIRRIEADRLAAASLDSNRP